MKNKVCSVPILFFLLIAFAFPSEKSEFSLSQLISLGLKNNPVLLAKFQEAEAKKAAFKASKLLANLELEFHKGEGKFYDGTLQRNTDGVSLSQYLENPMKRHYRLRMSEREWQAAEHLFNFSKLEVIYEIKSLFYKILLLQNKEELAKKNLISLEETHQLIVKRVELGEARELDAIKLYVETLKARNELNRTQTELKLAEENLNKSLEIHFPVTSLLSGS